MGSLAPSTPPGVNLDVEDAEFRRLVAMVVNNILTGKLHNTGAMTFVHGGVSTTVSDARCGISSVILLQASNADGAAALNTWYISTITDGSFTITHVSTSTSTATADYTVFG